MDSCIHGRVCCQIRRVCCAHLLPKLNFRSLLCTKNVCIQLIYIIYIYIIYYIYIYWCICVCVSTLGSRQANKIYQKHEKIRRKPTWFVGTDYFSTIPIYVPWGARPLPIRIDDLRPIPSPFLRWWQLKYFWTCSPFFTPGYLGRWSNLTNTPLKINGWNMSSWRFGSDHFPFF